MVRLDRLIEAKLSVPVLMLVALKFETFIRLQLRVPAEIRLADMVPVVILLALRFETVIRLQLSVPAEILSADSVPVVILAADIDPVVMLLAEIVQAPIVPPEMRAADIVSVVIFEALRLGIRTASKVPEVILLQLRLGIRTEPNVPLVILSQSKFGILADASVSPPHVPPVTVRLETVVAPAGVTRKGAPAKAVAPSHSPTPTFIWMRVAPDPVYKPSVASIVNPAMVPLFDVIAPAASTENFGLEEPPSFSVPLSRSSCDPAVAPQLVDSRSPALT